MSSPVEMQPRGERGGEGGRGRKGEWLREVGSLATGLSCTPAACAPRRPCAGARHLGGVEVEWRGLLTGGKWCALIEGSGVNA